MNFDCWQRRLLNRELMRLQTSKECLTKQFSYQFFLHENILRDGIAKDLHKLEN